MSILKAYTTRRGTSLTQNSPALYKTHCYETSPKQRALVTTRALTILLRYSDDHYEYRHVQLPKGMLKVIPKDLFDGKTGTLKLLWEDEWRGLGITQSLGWEHYEVHEPEPHILLFKYV